MMESQKHDTKYKIFRMFALRSTKKRPSSKFDFYMTFNTYLKLLRVIALAKLKNIHFKTIISILL